MARAAPSATPRAQKCYPSGDRLPGALTLGEVQIQERDPEASGEKQPEKADSSQPRRTFLRDELVVDHRARSRASAAKRSAR